MSKYFKVLYRLLNIIYPTECLGCGKNGQLVCSECLLSIAPLETQECPNCRASSEFGTFCNKTCRERFLKVDCFFDHLIVCSKYDKTSLLKKLIERLKYKFSEELTDDLSSLLQACVSSSASSPELINFFDQLFVEGVFVIPVPLHKKRLRDRGFNQAELLARSLGRPIFDVMIRTVYTPPQAHLNRRNRLRNLTGAFILKKGQDELVAGRSVILIDDVCTTGSTLNECAKVLKQAGASKIVALVLARGDRR
jgi:competence protein ComFC